MKESDIQSALRIKASREGWRLWRNNVGAGMLDNGSFVRWGLANDSTAVNHSVKSGDLVGIRPVIITPGMVGSAIGQFASLEVKRPEWKFNPNNPRDVAQKRWMDLVNNLGGYAIVSTGNL